MGTSTKPREGRPPADEIWVEAINREEGERGLYRLRTRAVVQTSEMILKADEIDYNENTGYAEARGHVLFDYYASGEHLEADRAEYSLATQEGRFYEVRGSTPAKLQARPGILTTTSPFSFQGKWAERIGKQYILHEGFITNCKLPNPWWRLKGPTFDIIPGERAITRNSVFLLRGVPLFYTPRFYKSLEEQPRKSGFLTPNFGNSSRRGLLFGGGYYWAINRSYDAMYRSQWFTERGFGHNVDFRGKPGARTDFNFTLYGVNDRGLLRENGERDPPISGALFNLSGKSDLGNGWTARGTYNYLSSFAFRQEFTESFYEAISSEVQSLGSITKRWSTYGFNVVASRVESFQSVAPNDKVTLRRLPSFEFNSRDKEINRKVLPVWVSWNSSASFLRRRQQTFQTGQMVDRFDFEPRITTALHWKDFHVLPSFSVRETSYGASFGLLGQVVDNNFLRSSREFATDIQFPTISKVFEKPPATLGVKLKHVIEPRASFRYVKGIGDDFRKIIRFDDVDILTNTNEATFGLINRLYAKRTDGSVEEIVTWEVAYRRFFDPCFGGQQVEGRCVGGALQEGRRNVILSSVSLTGISFLDVARRYSPITSSLRLNPRPGLGIEWMTDYDPFRGQIVNSYVAASAYFANGISFTAGHNQVRNVPIQKIEIEGLPPEYVGLSPSINQVSGRFAFGQENKRGWSAAATTTYDVREARITWSTVQVTYNTDCCGYSAQYQRFAFGARNQNQFRIALAVANIGSFGTLRKQERLF